ncbi:HDOD domain-containing protein [Candidatus Endoriftia persephone]|jgi:HD-like signal output (HDOD) protein|uniref:Cyclic nucleotide-binding protein n=3 Tax=Gammaproteobacteria TaxID=1236 RepID=G2FH34_9GAMM|nr:HDOD domain-containing protein [Candidatus Endoriftia persephone]EGV50756.1 cyclic nucleotide-binding protein [endosymbiont of Riftia pachyptila (vent Ph05)]EGW53848.1 cyclic nucleotide-binding protein [endosymbiont of Tevnia jerichonana (vent Tica)]USF87699.1 HDOD domain-containing protein [Candidatus Endoriftia persephone]
MFKNTGRHPTPEQLKRFNPLSELTPQQHELLSNSLAIYTASEGKRLLKLGASEPFSLYLLKGRVNLHSADDRHTSVEAGSTQASRPIAHLTPRQYDVTAAEDVEYFMLDNQLLNDLILDQLQQAEPEILFPSGQHHIPAETENDLSQTLLRDLEADQLVLPSLPDVAARIGRAMASEWVAAEKLARIIESDPAITAKLIRVANSALYRVMAPVDSCLAAVVRLGNNTTYQLVLSFALRELFQARSPQIKQQMEALWQHSTKVAAICFVLTDFIKGFDREQALLAGLIHDIGEVAILNYAERFPNVANDAARLKQVRSEMRGQIGSRILQRWGFIDDMVQVPTGAEAWLRDGAEDADYTDLVVVAQLHSYIGTDYFLTLPSLDQIPAFYKLGLSELTPELSIQILDDAKERLAAAEALFG